MCFDAGRSASRAGEIHGYHLDHILFVIRLPPGRLIGDLSEFPSRQAFAGRKLMRGVSGGSLDSI